MQRVLNVEREQYIGSQAGSRTSLSTDDFWRDFHEMLVKRIEFERH